MYRRTVMENNLQKIEILQSQIAENSIPDDLLVQKLHLLRYLCELEEMYAQSDEYSSKIIEIGTPLAKTNLEYLKYVKDAYFTRAKRHFDDYMIACEWDRVPNARFWLPRRKILEGKHKVCTTIDNFINHPTSKFLSISLPPGTGKSTLIKFLMAFVCGTDPQSANMYVSYSDGMVKMMIESLTSILTDVNEYKHNDIFGSTREPDVSKEYNTVSYRRKGDFPTFGLVSLGGSVTGRTRANRFLITDDLVKNREVASSPDRLNKLYEDYKSTLTTRMIGDNVKQIMLGTMWSAYDPINRTMKEHENDPDYQFITIPVWDEQEESNFLYEHPDNYSVNRIRDIKATIDPVDFSCLYMQRGVEKGGLAFSDDQLKFYNGVLPDGEPDNIFFACDVAWGGGDSLSMPIIYEYGGDWYMHDVVHDNGDKFHTKPRVMGKILQHHIRMGRFEANNGGDEYADDVSKQLKEFGYSCNISHKKATGNMGKLVRIEQHAPNIKEIYFRSPGNRDSEYSGFMRELNTFSFTAKNLHDDAPDALAQAVDFRLNGVRSGVVSRIRRTGNL